MSLVSAVGSSAGFESLVTSFLRESNLHDVVWLKESAENSPFGVYVPETEKRTAEEAKRACRVAIVALEIYRCYINTTELHHMSFLGLLPRSFFHFRDHVEMGELEEKMNGVIRLSHLAFHQRQLAHSTPALATYQDHFKWDELPYDKTLRANCDVVFLVGSEQCPIPVPSGALLKRFPCYFSALLGSTYNINPKNDGIVIPEVASSTFMNFIHLTFKERYPQRFDALVDLACFLDMIGEKIEASPIFAKIGEHFHEISVHKLLATFNQIYLCSPLCRLFAIELMKHFKELDLNRLDWMPLFYLAESDDLPLSEWQLLKALIDWEKHRLTEDDAPGKILREQLEVRKRLIDCVRFENVSHDSFMRHMQRQPWLNAEEQVRFLGMIWNRGKPQIGEGVSAYRLRRGEFVHVDIINDTRCEATIRIMLTEKDLRFPHVKKSQAIEKRSEKFSMFGRHWHIAVDKQATYTSAPYHAVKLVFDSTDPIEVDYQFSFGKEPNIHVQAISERLRVRAGKTGEYKLGVENKPSLISLLYHDILYIKLTCTHIHREPVDEGYDAF